MRRFSSAEARADDPFNDRPRRHIRTTDEQLAGTQRGPGNSAGSFVSFRSPHFPIPWFPKLHSKRTIPPPPFRCLGVSSPPPRRARTSSKRINYSYILSVDSLPRQSLVYFFTDRKGIIPSLMTAWRIPDETSQRNDWLPNLGK